MNQLHPRPRRSSALARRLRAFAAPVAQGRRHGQLSRSSPSATCSTMPASSPSGRCSAPRRPGTTGIVSLDATCAQRGQARRPRRLRECGIARVRVDASATVVDAAMLTDLISADLPQRGILAGDVTAERSLRRSRRSSFNAEAVAEPGDSSSACATCRATARFAARFQIAGIDLPVDVTGTHRADGRGAAPRRHAAGRHRARRRRYRDEAACRCDFAETSGIVRTRRPRRQAAAPPRAAPA